MAKLWKVDKEDLVKIEFYIPKEWYAFMQEFLEWAGYETEEEKKEELQLELSCRLGMWINFILHDEPMVHFPKKVQYFIEKYDLKDFGLTQPEI